MKNLRQYIYTVWCRYKRGQFFTNIHKCHGRAMGCLLWIQHRIDIVSVPVIIDVISYNIGLRYNCSQIFIYIHIYIYRDIQIHQHFSLQRSLFICILNIRAKYYSYMSPHIAYMHAPWWGDRYDAGVTYIACHPSGGLMVNKWKMCSK